MNLVQVKSPVSISGGIEGLDDILWPGVDLTLWRRERPGTLNWLDRQDWDPVSDVDSIVMSQDLHSQVARLLQAAHYPPGARTAALAHEVAELATYFATLMGCSSLRLRLEIVETDGCKKFHADYVRARLLSTLSGRGTEWIYAASQGADAAVEQMAAGDVGIFKGRLWEEEPAILHRSPPIDASGEQRLLLAIDPAGEAA